MRTPFVAVFDPSLFIKSGVILTAVYDKLHILYSCNGQGTVYTHIMKKFVLVDIETTGTSNSKDSILEVAAVQVHNNKVVNRFESLVHPKVPIPSFIQQFTGITPALVADAPSFSAIAEELQSFLEGHVFVAHNVHFDYGFIRSHFRSLNMEYEAPKLCTVKVSRALYPNHRKHSLDALIERFSFPSCTRHRAMGDVEALIHFWNHIHGTFPSHTLDYVLTPN